jgi:GNAT superfamily N-acetyltransferase
VNVSSQNELPDVSIRALHDNDDVLDGLPAVGPDADTPQWHRTLVAIANGQVVGTASLSLSPAIDLYFCAVTVIPGYRRRGIGTRLYAAIYELTDPTIPVVTRAMSSQPVRRQFAESLGCSVLVHCPAPWVDPNSKAGQQWIAQQQLPDGYQTVAMDDLPIDRVEQAWATYFEWAHRPFGTVHSEHLPNYWAWYGSGLDGETSMVTIDASTQAVVALSLVTPDAWDGRTMIVSETVHEDQPDGDRLLRSTAAASLSRLAARGHDRVELEGHSADAHSPQLVRSLPPAGGDPMDVLKLLPPRGNL